MRCFTLGHSTLAFHAFIALLRAHGVEQVADGRLTYPGDAQRALPLGAEEAGPASSGGETNLEATKPERRSVS